MTDEELRKLFDEARQQIEASAVETRRYVDESIGRSALETRLNVDESIGRSTVETHHYVDEAVAQMRRHLDVHAESAQTKFALLAEGQQSLNEKLEREASDIRDEMRRGFAETQAMIKFSHAELDRRVITLEHGHRTLEDKVEKLEDRVDRLESSTH